jgi:hypothetical protein
MLPVRDPHVRYGVVTAVRGVGLGVSAGGACALRE